MIAGYHSLCESDWDEGLLIDSSADPNHSVSFVLYRTAHQNKRRHQTVNHLERRDISVTECTKFCCEYILFSSGGLMMMDNFYQHD